MSGKKLICSNCKKKKQPQEYSDRQRKFAASHRKCKICVKEICTESLQSSQYNFGKRKIDVELNESTSRMDGEKWKIDEKKKKEREEAREKRNLLTPSSKNNSHKMNTFHDNSIPFCFTVDKEKKMREVREALKVACNKVLAEINDTDLLDAAKSRYCSTLYSDESIKKEDALDFTTNKNIRVGIYNCYHSLPSSSPIRASFIKSIFTSNFPAASIASILDIDISNVYRALNSEIQPLDYFMRDLGFMRDRLGERGDELHEWFVERCGPTSGRHKRYYAYGMRMNHHLFRT